MTRNSTVHEITIELGVPVPMRDGTVLRADVYRPASAGTFPVLLSRSPHGKSVLWEGMLEFKAMVTAGYVVIFQDCRGRFASEGEWLPWKHEREDGHDTVEGAASLPYSNGKVGMFAASYLGSTQWSAAIAGPPHLAAIAPITTWSDPADGLMFRGGAVELGVNLQFSLLQALGQCPKAGLTPEETLDKTLATMRDLDARATKTYWQLPSAAQPAIIDSGQPDMGVARALADPTTMDECRVSNRYDDIDLPTLNIGGWYDIFLQGTLDNYVGLRSRGRTTRLVVGPWDQASLASAWAGGRVGEVTYGLGSMLPGGRTVTELTRGWYDHWLKELPANSGPRVRRTPVRDGRQRMASGGGLAARPG
jgi:putative CocE/NonD family hydrolase